MATAAATGTDAAGSAAAGEGTANVAVLFDVTGRGDKSFNDAAAAGLDKAVADFGVNPTESTPSGEGDRAERLSAAIADGNDLVIAVGYLASAGFEQLYVMYNVSVLATADILETLTLRLGLEQSDYGLATAVGLFQGVISLTLVGVANFAVRRSGSDGLF